jgi:hypothetical protein
MDFLRNRPECFCGGSIRGSNIQDDGAFTLTHALDQRHLSLEEIQQITADAVSFD